MKTGTNARTVAGVDVAENILIAVDPMIIMEGAQAVDVAVGLAGEI